MIIKEGDCSNAWKFVSRNYANGSSQIIGIYFDQPYITVAHFDPFRINVATTNMHGITARILVVSNAFQNIFFSHS